MADEELDNLLDGARFCGRTFLAILFGRVIRLSVALQYPHYLRMSKESLSRSAQEVLVEKKLSFLFFQYCPAAAWHSPDL